MLHSGLTSVSAGSQTPLHDLLRGVADLYTENGAMHPFRARTVRLRSDGSATITGSVGFNGHRHIARLHVNPTIQLQVM